LIEFESNELFLTSFDKLQNIEFVTNSLTNQTFKHRFIFKNCIIIIAFINESFAFNFISIINSRYDDREFKSIQWTAMQQTDSQKTLSKSKLYSESATSY
jgi:hypothetical protein